MFRKIRKCHFVFRVLHRQTIKTNKKGLRYLSGNCIDCGCKMNRFLKKDVVLTQQEIAILAANYN